MESRSSENSLSFSDKESPAWVKLWNSNYSSTGGLNIGKAQPEGRKSKTKSKSSSLKLRVKVKVMKM